MQLTLTDLLKVHRYFAAKIAVNDMLGRPMGDPWHENQQLDFVSSEIAVRTGRVLDRTVEPTVEEIEFFRNQFAEIIAENEKAVEHFNREGGEG